MKTLDQLPDLLNKMLSEQKEQKNKTYVARYKGQNLIVRSGKSSWKKVGHAKTAIIQHFDNEEREYKYRDWEPGPGCYDIVDEREKEFRAALWKLIEIVELT